jgi:hypothetical protein
MIMRYLPILIILAASIAKLGATPQEPDTLLHKGVPYSVQGFRLKTELSKKLYELMNSDKRWITSSALWRGYKAVLQIREEKLYLMAVSLNTVEPKPPLAEILGFDIPDQGVHADFFTGELYHGFGQSWGDIHSSASGDQHMKLRKYVFERGMLKSVSEVETEKPLQLIQDRIIEDIEMLNELLKETSEENPFGTEGSLEEIER